jgi:hypothetical protein
MDVITDESIALITLRRIRRRGKRREGGGRAEE